MPVYIYNVVVTQTQPTLLDMPPFIYMTDSPDILFDSFALGSIPEPETPKPTHDCTHNRVRKYPSIPASQPPITYIHVPNRTAPHHQPPMPNFISFSRLHDNPWVSKKKKHTKLSHAGTNLPVIVDWTVNPSIASTHSKVSSSIVSFMSFNQLSRSQENTHPIKSRSDGVFLDGGHQVGSWCH